MRKKWKLLFYSRHYPSTPQIEMVKELGFAGIELKRVTFPDNKAELKKMLANESIRGKMVAITAPTWIHVTFWEMGISTIEFVQGSKKKNNPKYYGFYYLVGLWLYSPKPDGGIDAAYKPSKLSFEEQAKLAGRPIEDE